MILTLFAVLSVSESLVFYTTLTRFFFVLFCHFKIVLNTHCMHLYLHILKDLRRGDSSKLSTKLIYNLEHMCNIAVNVTLLKQVLSTNPVRGYTLRFWFLLIVSLECVVL